MTYFIELKLSNFIHNFALSYIKDIIYQEKAICFIETSVKKKCMFLD